jgi:hypothetical protein
MVDQFKLTSKGYAPFSVISSLRKRLKVTPIEVQTEGRFVNRQNAINHIKGWKYFAACSKCPAT